MKTPAHYNPVMPYLMIKDTDAFISFMKAVFITTEQIIVPNADGSLMHGELKLDDAVIMFSGANEMYPAFPGSICLLRDDIDEVYNRANANGAVSLQEPDNREYGRSAGFADMFGNKWWLMNPNEDTPVF